MKIVVLNGSPKGNLSTTLQYVRFMEKKFPANSFQVFNIAHDIRKIETDETIFRGIIDGMKDADCILWAFPLYYFLVAAQYKRFIELIWEKGAMGVFKGKFTAALSTSIHLFDHMAHNYIHAICDDLEIGQLTLTSGETITPHENFYCVATMNDVPECLPEGLRDRFPIKINIDFFSTPLFAFS